MAIFNSLGSNYTFGFALQALFTLNLKKHHNQLIKLLEKKYSGVAVLTYKGREAFRLALRICDKKGSTVAICGFTCFAVYDACKRERYDIEYLDIEKDSLHFSLTAVQKAVHKNPKIKIVIIQNTLGYPCEAEKIAQYCKEKKLVLIEDLAHSIGAVYTNGSSAGTIGDMAVLSFSQDKMIDGVSGGALILRDENFKFPITNFQFQKLPFKKQLIDRFYPLFTCVIRNTYDSGFGKGFHAVLKKMNMLSKPMDNVGTDIFALPNWYCSLIIKGFKELEENVDRRRRISAHYKRALNPRILSKAITNQTNKSANLRFPIFVEHRQQLITFLKKHKIFISDIWYDAPIGPKKYLSKTTYKGECPNAEKTASKILNLPTHRNVSKNDAMKIAAVINQWTEL